MPVIHAMEAWSRKQSVCSGVSGTSKTDDLDQWTGDHYPFAVALRVRVLQIVCGIGGMVVGAVGWLEERHKPVLGFGVIVGLVTILAATMSVYYSRGFGGWTSARSKTTIEWGVPWRALGPSPCSAIPLTVLWTAAITGHVVMVVFCSRSLLNIGCNSKTCSGVAGTQLSLSMMTLAAQMYMVHLDIRYDAAVSPPPRHTSDTHTCTAVSMVPLNSITVNSGGSSDGMGSCSPKSNLENTKESLKCTHPDVFIS